MAEAILEAPFGDPHPPLTGGKKFTTTSDQASQGQWLESFRTDYTFTAPILESDQAFERFTVTPEKCWKLSAYSIDTGTGTCISHARQLIKPSDDGTVVCDVNINCEDSGTGPGGTSSRRATEVPALDFVFYAPGSGRISFAASWTIEKSSISLRTSDSNILWPSDCYVHGKHMHELVAWIKSPEWKTLPLQSGQAVKSLNKKATSNVDASTRHTVDQVYFTHGSSTTVGVNKGDLLAVRSAMIVTSYLYLSSVRASARTYVKAKFAGFVVDIVSKEDATR